MKHLLIENNNMVQNFEQLKIGTIIYLVHKKFADSSTLFGGKVIVCRVRSFCNREGKIFPIYREVGSKWSPDPNTHYVYTRIEDAIQAIRTEGLKTELPEHVFTVREAENFLASLIDNNEIFHPEDDPREVIWETCLPTEKECEQLNILMQEISKLDFDACAYIMEYRQV